MAPRQKKRRKNQAAVTAAAKRRDWLVGDLVVAKLRGHRPWPAQIQRPEDYGYEARPHRIFVTFFGTEETCFCTHNKITPFTSAMRKIMAEQLQKINTNPELERAIKEIFAADDELKVSMKSQNKSDDEKSDGEDEQVAEASSKPPRKKAKIGPQENAAVQDPVAHGVGKESTRPTRAGAAAAAAAAAAIAAAQSSKVEKATGGGSSVKNMAAHQVQKLPRKVRIKVSSQSSDSGNHQSFGEVTVAVRDKASVSSPSEKSAESPSRSEIDTEKRADATCSPSPKSTAADAECSKNGDVEMEEATGQVTAGDVEVSRKSGEHSSAEAAEDKNLSKANEGESAKIEVSGHDENMGEPHDVEEEDAAEDSEKDCESTAIKMETDAPLKAEIEAVAVEETDQVGKVEITASSTDEDKVERHSSVVAEEGKGHGDAAKEAHAGGEDGKVAAAMETEDDVCQRTSVRKVEEHPRASSEESEEKSKLGDNKAITVEEEKVVESVTIAAEVKVAASTIEATPESKDCEPPVDAIELDKVSYTSIGATPEIKDCEPPVDAVEVSKVIYTPIEAREEGNVCNSTSEPMQVETKCGSATEEREEDPAGERTVIAEGDQRCAETESAGNNHIFREPPGCAKEEVNVTTEIPKDDARDSEAPTSAKEEMKDLNPPAIIEEEVKGTNSHANVRVEDFHLPATAKDGLGDSSADAAQEKACENAEPVQDAVQEIAHDSDRAVVASTKGKDCHSTSAVDTVERDSGAESTPQVKQGAQDLERTPAEKVVESETTAMTTATKETVEKHQDVEGDKDEGKVDGAVDESFEGIPAEKGEKMSESVVEDGVHSKTVASDSEHEQIRKDETASAAPAAD